MDIKIRSQSKISLYDCTHKDIGITGRGAMNTIIISENGNVNALGTYKTEERAMEVLDDLQNAIDFAIKQDNRGIIIQMPEE